MKKLVLSLFGVGALASVAFAGTEYSGKEMKQVAPAPAPCPEWYADNEWNVSLWGAYAFTGTDNNRGSIDDVFFKAGGDYDRFLGGDHAWGGGLDAKYFFRRYFGVGVEGFGLVKPIVVVLMFKLCRFLMAQNRVSIVLTLISFWRAISPTLKSAPMCLEDITS